MVVCLLWIASALAGTVIEGAGGNGPHEKVHRDTDAWREGLRAPIPGILGLEAKLEQMDTDIHEVVMLDARWTGSLDIDAMAAGTTTKKKGQPKALTLQVQRVADGSLVAASREGSDARWDRGRIPADRACAYANNPDPRAVTLATWDDSVRPQGGSTQGDAGATHATMFWITGQDGRTALVHLAPGESATVVELGDEIDGEATRQVRVRRNDRMLEVTEDDSVQRVCLQFGLPALVPEVEAKAEETSPWHGAAEVLPWDAPAYGTAAAGSGAPVPVPAPAEAPAEEAAAADPWGAPEAPAPAPAPAEPQPADNPWGY